ncbi:MAG: hypothetical protein WBD87_08070 [Candidatus Acidiferrales bacterium]
MPRFRRLGSLTAFSVVAVLTVAVASAVPSQRGSSVPSWQQTYAFMRKFLLAAYPDLPKGSLWTISETSPFDHLPVPHGDFSVEIQGELIPHDYEGHIIYGQAFTQGPLLSGVLTINPSGRLERAHILGFWANSEANDKFQKSSELHTRWTDAQIAKALEKAGARFGASQKVALLHHIPLDALSDAIGVHLTIQSAEFVVDRFVENDGPCASPSWTVTLQGREGGRAVEYGASFEPFGGRLTFLLLKTR